LPKALNSFLRALKNKGFEDGRITKIGLYDTAYSTTLESNKSQIQNRRFLFKCARGSYIYGGLVLCPLTLDYLRTWGPTWYDKASAHLLNAYFNGKASEPGEEVVVLIKVLPAAMNIGYQSFVNRRIVAVNEQRIHNLRELIALAEQPTDDAFIVFRTADNE
jgi:hypothetical protein